MDMKANELGKLLERIDNAITHEKYMSTDKSMWDYIVKEKLKLKSYTKSDLEADIKKLKEFRAKGFDLYNRDFWGISIHESICACASPMSSKLRLVTHRINTRITTKYKRPTEKTLGHTDVFVGGEYIGYIMPNKVGVRYSFTAFSDDYKHLSSPKRKVLLAEIGARAMIVNEF